MPVETTVTAGMRRAALAFSALPSHSADEISHLLSMRERVRLRAGLIDVRDAPASERRAALYMLVRATRDGLDWPTPESHDEATCPFRMLERYPAEQVGRAIDHLATRRPLHAAVALSHLGADERDVIWEHVERDQRAAIVYEFSEIPRFSPTRTRAVARALESAITETPALR